MKSQSVFLSGVPQKHLSAVLELLAELGLLWDTHGTEICVKQAERLSLKSTPSGIELTYRKPNELFRAISLLPDFLKDGKEVQQSTAFTSLCYMADQSRNAVYNMETAKRTIRCLAAMGYDSFMLYTEDTIELPDYPYFGHMRGRFSAEQLRELDRYADSFGIELIPCLQTLAHLSTALRWPDFDGYTDNGDILLVGDDRTYAFIEALFKQCRNCFSSNQIHIGMDEAFMLGRGNYLTKNGYRPSSEIMMEHLTRVVQLCEKYGYQPIMWSDMFFRVAFGTYRVAEGEVPQEIIDRTPKNVTLVYWDYHLWENDNMYDHMMHCHNCFENSVAFAGGSGWKEYGFTTKNYYAIEAYRRQIAACKRNHITSLMVTGWGDDGAEASQFSGFSTLLYVAEACYEQDCENHDWMNARGEACIGTGYDNLLCFDLPNLMPGDTEWEKRYQPINPCKYLLYNDPLERLMDAHLDRSTAPKTYRSHAERLMSLKDDKALGYAFETMGKLCRVLASKCDLGIRLYEAYNADNREALAEIANAEIPQLIADTEDFLATFRRQWYRENKTFGFTTHDIRIGGLIMRLRVTAERISDYLNGSVAHIEELEQKALPVIPASDGEYISYPWWRSITSAGQM